MFQDSDIHFTVQHCIYYIECISVVYDNVVTECFFYFSGKYAQVTNNPENDGCINAVLLV